MHHAAIDRVMAQSVALGRIFLSIAILNAGVEEARYRLLEELRVFRVIPGQVFPRRPEGRFHVRQEHRLPTVLRLAVLIECSAGREVAFRDS